jgi:hypothetical protein
LLFLLLSPVGTLSLKPYETGASRYVFCVNVDAVIAALMLAVLWKDYRSGALTEKDPETAAFNVFLYGRMIGAAAEIDDHLNRGRNMDTRTPQEQCAFVVCACGGPFAATCEGKGAGDFGSCVYRKSDSVILVVKSTENWP